MIGVGDKYLIQLLPSQMRIARGAEHNGDVALILQNCSEPKKCQRQSANVLGENAAALANWRGKLQRKISRAAAEIHNDVAWAHIQSLYDLGRALPLIAFRFDHVQARNGVES